MVFLLQLIVLGLLILIGLQIWNAATAGRDSQVGRQTKESLSDGRETPAQVAADTLREFENARTALKNCYPLIFAMLGGYLNSHTISEAESLELAVREMIADWKARHGEVSHELAKVLAENESEEECRALVLAACDADFEREGYRTWLTWLLGQFNDIRKT